MIKDIYKWNNMYKMVMLIKEDYNSTFNDGEKVFKEWLRKLDNSVWDDLFSCIQTTQRGRFLLLRYGLHDLEEGMWTKPNSIYRECRSLVIDLENDNIVLSPYKKFFNLGETEDNSLENILEKLNNAEVVEFADKLDGSMVSAGCYEGELFVSTSKAIDPKDSWRLEDAISMFDKNYTEFIKSYPYMTFIFEYISLKDAHVVNYDKKDEGLYLIGGRSLLTGREINYSEVKYLANKYGLKCVDLETDITFNELLDRSKIIKANEKEGWVINIDGHRVKIKGDEYTNLHRLLSIASSPNVIIRAVADGTFDDVYSKMPDLYKPRILKIAKLLWERDKELRTLARELSNKMKEFETRKEAMIWLYEQEVPKKLNRVKGYAIFEYDGKEYNVFKKRAMGYYNLNQLNIDEDYVNALYFDRTQEVGNNDEQ